MASLSHRGKEIPFYWYSPKAVTELLYIIHIAFCHIPSLTGCKCMETFKRKNVLSTVLIQAYDYL